MEIIFIMYLLEIFRKTLFHVDFQPVCICVFMDS
jgi:hypothetical protein